MNEQPRSRSTMANNYTGMQIHTGENGRVQLGNNTYNTYNTYDTHESKSQQVTVEGLIKDLTLTEAAEDLRRVLRRGRWTEGTCEWILDRPEFHDWYSGDGLQSLWVVGPPGSGKTVISCFLVDVFQAHFETHPTGFVYYFCDDKDELRRTAVSVLRGLIVQLLKANHRVFDVVKADYERRGKDIAKTVDSLWTVLIPIVKHFGAPVYMMIDALDECEEGSRSELLDLINSLNESVDLKILITSRPETFTGEIDSVMIDIRLNSDEINHDLAMFIDQKTMTMERKYSTKTVETIKETVLERAGGTFLWASLILDHIAGARTSKSAIKKLESMPTTLGGLCQEILLQILDEDENDAAQVLRWVALSRRPMTRSELATAMLLCSGEWENSSNTAPSEEDVEELKDLYKSCGQLLFLDEASQTVNLIHQSAKDYLSTLGPSSQYHIDRGSAGMEIIRTCWTYLQLDFVSGLGSTDNLRTERVKPRWLAWSRSYLFLPYASEEVFDSASEDNLERVAAFVDECQDLGQLPPVRDYWLNLFANLGDAGRVQTLCEKGAPPGGPPLSYERGEAGWKAVNQIRRRDGEEDSILPLHSAARMGHIEVCEILIRNGADINALDESRKSALFWAVKHDQRDVVALLLQEGAKLGSGIALIHEALDHESEETALCLMASEACLQIDDEKLTPSQYWTGKEADRASLNLTLGTAIRKGFYGVAKGLLEAGANPIRAATPRNCSGPPLAIAIKAGQLNMASLLIDSGSGVGLIPGDHMEECYLGLAIAEGDIAMVKLLIDQGADIEVTETWMDIWIDMRHRSPLTALCIASREGEVSVAEALIEAGAKLDRGSLHLAALYGRKDMVELLLDKGEDPRRNHGFWHNTTPLHLAAQGGHCEILALLLGRGSDIEDRDERGWTALHYAVVKLEMSVVVFLLEHGATVRARTSKNETALHLIAQASTNFGRDAEVLDMARTLVGEGLGVEDVDCHGRTALHYVVEGSAKATAKFLIDQGIDINAKTSNGCSPLHLACTSYTLQKLKSSPPHRTDRIVCGQGRHEMCQLLVDRGADDQARDGKGRSVLFRAAASRERTVCDFLLRRGLQASEMCSHDETSDYPALDRLEKLQETWRLTVLPSPPLGGYWKTPSKPEQMLMDALFQMATYFLARDNPSAGWLYDAVEQRFDLVLSMLRPASQDTNFIDGDDLRWVLFEICRQGDLEGLRALLGLNTDILSSQDVYEYALQRAIAFGWDPMFWYLFELRIESYTRGSPSFDASFYAQLFTMLLGWGTSMWFVEDSEHEDFGEEDLENMIVATKRFLNLGQDVEGPGDESFLIQAVRFGNPDMIDVLLAHGADVAARSTDGATVMECALLAGNESVIFTLLKRGVDFNKFETTTAEILSYRLPKHFEDIGVETVRRILESLPDVYSFKDKDVESLMRWAHFKVHDGNIIDHLWRIMDPYQRARIFGYNTYLRDTTTVPLVVIPSRSQAPLGFWRVF